MSLLSRVSGRCLACGDCLLWQGATNHKGHPKLAHKSARRVVWEETAGRKLSPSELVTVACGNSLCLRFGHLKITTKSEVARITNASEAVKLKRSAASARTNQAKFGKLDMDKARYIRQSGKTGVELAAELSVSKDLVSKVRLHRAWKEYSNPFGGLIR